MKILQINSVCGIGSTGRIATDLYEILKEQGNECKIAYGRDMAKNIPTEDLIKIGIDYDVNIHALMTRITDKTGFYSKKATQKLIEQIIEYDPDIIHLHNIHGYYINIELLFNYLVKANKPLVWTLHDCWSFTGHCAHFDYIGCNKWKTVCCDCPQKKSYPQSLFLDNSQRNFKKKKELFTSIKKMTIVTPSQWLGDLVNESFLSKYEVEVIPNGIDLSVFKPSDSAFRIKNKLENMKIILGVASVWGTRKGLNDFIKLSKMLDDNYKIILVGLKENQIKTLPKEILGIYRTNNVTELAEIYTMADVFVNPTYEDNFPTTNLEALACGTPVITYKTGGSPESLDETCGLAVEKGNIDMLYESIFKICEKKPFSSEACIARSKMFDKNRRFNEYIDIYGVK